MHILSTSRVSVLGRDDEFSRGQTLLGRLKVRFLETKRLSDRIRYASKWLWF